MNFRTLHRKIAPFIFLPLLLSALSGVTYRVGKDWFGLSGGFRDVMMSIHQGSYLGQSLSSVYVLLVALGLVGAIATGVSMLLRMRTQRRQSSPATQSPRSLHRAIAPIFFLPLLVSASTGVTYRFAETLGLPLEQTQLMLRLHQGSYLGQPLRVFYVLAVGLGLVGLLATGIQMTGIFRKRRTT
jgi:uncharacterized iron-regulated membrane protein